MVSYLSLCHSFVSQPLTPAPTLFLRPSSGGFFQSGPARSVGENVNNPRVLPSGDVADDKHAADKGDDFQDGNDKGTDANEETNQRKEAVGFNEEKRRMEVCIAVIHIVVFCSPFSNIGFPLVFSVIIFFHS